MLRYFYSELRNKSGGYYSKSTLVCIRAALYRYFKTERMFDIILEQEFFHANQILKSVIKTYTENGGLVKKYEAIEEDDMKKLRLYFDRENPEKLQQEIYFVMVYYLGLRGREWIRRVNRKQLSFETDSKGNEFAVFKGLEAMLKNYQPKLSKTESDPTDGSIYSTDNLSTCPVTALKLFLHRLPEGEFFFYKPITNWKFSDYWYNPKLPLGVNTIGSLMSIISKHAGLSKMYTGHCIRSTVVTNLFNKGIAIDEISCVTGHKHSNSVKKNEKYLRHVSDERRIGFSMALSSAMNTEISENNDTTSVGSSSTLNHGLNYSSSNDSECIVRGPATKKMLIEADGNTNKVKISFQWFIPELFFNSEFIVTVSCLSNFSALCVAMFTYSYIIDTSSAWNNDIIVSRSWNHCFTGLSIKIWVCIDVFLKDNRLYHWKSHTMH